MALFYFLMFAIPSLATIIYTGGRTQLRSRDYDCRRRDTSAYLTVEAKVFESSARFCTCLTKPGAVSAKQSSSSSPPRK